MCNVYELSSIVQKEYEIAEILFFPNGIKSSSAPRIDPDSNVPLKKGSRTSARQREKQARILAIRQEKEKAREMAGKRCKVRLQFAITITLLSQTFFPPSQRHSVVNKN